MTTQNGLLAQVTKLNTLWTGFCSDSGLGTVGIRVQVVLLIALKCPNLVSHFHIHLTTCAHRCYGWAGQESKDSWEVTETTLLYNLAWLSPKVCSLWSRPGRGESPLVAMSGVLVVEGGWGGCCTLAGRMLLIWCSGGACLQEYHASHVIISFFVWWMDALCGACQECIWAFFWCVGVQHVLLHVHVM